MPDVIDIQIIDNCFFTMKRILILSAIVVLCFCHAQGGGMTVMFYNVENLFDIYDNPNTDDDEFTPEGEKRWTENRYWNKLNNICKVIVSIEEMESPAIVGLCEVESDTVLYDLTKRTALKNLGYDYIVTHSSDSRGINVAFLYKSVFFKMIYNETLHVSLLPHSENTTRDILHVSGRIESGDTLDCYVCHWPSRIGGIEQTEVLRSEAAKVLSRSVAQVLAKREDANILIMGDLNEGPDEDAVRKALKAVPWYRGLNANDKTLVTLMDDVVGGSYRYEGIWNKYDQFIASASMINGSGFVLIDKIGIGDADFLLEADSKYGGMKPRRTYNGYRYQDAFSDHLPVYIHLSY